jgi:hypothetical protein
MQPEWPAARVRRDAISGGASQIMTRIAGNFGMIADPRAVNRAWLPDVQEQPRLAGTVAIEGLPEVPQKGIVT